MECSPALVVIAKAPVAGRSKTRLSPPCTPGQAALLAQAALADTLHAVIEAAPARVVLALDGRPCTWFPPRFEVIRQRAGDLAERLAGAFEDVGGPALVVGMDTPQLKPATLRAALAQLARPGTDAVLGAATDGGYWAIGLRRPDRRVFEGIPMSVAATGDAQRRRLRELGLGWSELGALRDVDDYADALAVAAEAPGSRFANALAALRTAALVPAAQAGAQAF